MPVRIELPVATPYDLYIPPHWCMPHTRRENINYREHDEYVRDRPGMMTSVEYENRLDILRHTAPYRRHNKDQLDFQYR